MIQYLVTDSQFLKKKKKKKIGVPNLGQMLENRQNFLNFDSLVFLEIAYNDSLQ